MKNLLYALALLFAGCASTAGTGGGFVSVDGNSFQLDHHTYSYIGANLWYGAMLGSEGEGGNRQRLDRELDTLAALGVTNLRVLAGAEGDTGLPYHVRPVLQTAPGEYNDTLLCGLDYLLSAMEQRGMKAVLYLNNAWEWSGGYTAYLQWAGRGNALMAQRDGWPAFRDYAAQFVLCPEALDMFYRHVRFIVGRTNSITGKPYAQSPAIMSWQVANEPRSYSDAGKEALLQMIDSTAKIIREIDPNHLVSTGSEGYHGCEEDLELWARIHRLPSIDYAIIHIWPYNWGWCDSTSLSSAMPHVLAETDEYIRVHREALPNKPLVIEEFGYPRDAMALAPASPTTARDAYYDHVFSHVTDSATVAGINFWAWGGEGKPAHRMWQPWDDYVGDPAQEPQGLYCVFGKDRSTVEIMKARVKRILDL